MIVYRITNILLTSIKIEDLGLLLPSGKSVIISADSHSRSEDLRRNERWIKSDIIHISNKVKPPKVHQKVIIVPEPVRKPPTFSCDSKIESQLNEIQKMLFQMMDASLAQTSEIKKKIEEVPNPAVVPFRPGMLHHHEYSQQSTTKPVYGDVPMFIPSTVVPDINISGTKTSDSEIDKDVDLTLDALKKLRKK